MRESIEDLRSCCRVFGGFEGTARGFYCLVMFVGIEWGVRGGGYGGDEPEVTGSKRGRLLEVAFEDGDSVSELWVEGGANSLRSPSRGGFLSDVVSLVQIFIRYLSER